MDTFPFCNYYAMYFYHTRSPSASTEQVQGPCLTWLLHACMNNQPTICATNILAGHLTKYLHKSRTLGNTSSKFSDALVTWNITLICLGELTVSLFAANVVSNWVNSDHSMRVAIWPHLSGNGWSCCWFCHCGRNKPYCYNYQLLLATFTDSWSLKI